MDDSANLAQQQRRNRRIFYGCLILLLSPYLAILGLRCYHRSLRGPTVKAPEILNAVNLAELPSSATDIKVHSWRKLFAGEDLLMFRASSQDIEAFVKDSPALKGVEPQEFSEEYQYLPYPDGFVKVDPKHEYFSPRRGSASWFVPAVREKGRRYDSGSAKGGRLDPHLAKVQVIVNERTGTVYVDVVWD